MGTHNYTAIKIALVTVVLLLFAATAQSACPPVSKVWNCVQVNQLSFLALEVFNGNPDDGSVVVTGSVPKQRTAIDLWPHNGPLPAAHAVTEFVLYGTRFQDWPRYSRFSISQMAGAAMVRLSTEWSQDQQEPIFAVCADGWGQFEEPCTLIVGSHGVWVRRDGRWIQIGDGAR